MEARRYYLYSAVAHAALLLAAVFLIKPAVRETVFPTYTVDFIGGAEATQVNDAAPATAAPAAQPEPLKPEPAAKAEPTKKIKPSKPAKTEIKAPKDKTKVLAEKPAPAVQPAREEKLAAPSMLDDEPAAAVPAAQTAAAAKSGAEPAGISAQFPNFPYPWYITQVRLALWNEWSARMPHSGNITSVVGFYVRRDGKLRKVTVERSSGNKLFDLAAMTSVENAAPFPPLPASYKEQELAVHVEFKIAQ